MRINLIERIAEKTDVVPQLFYTDHNKNGPPQLCAYNVPFTISLLCDDPLTKSYLKLKYGHEFVYVVCALSLINPSEFKDRLKIAHMLMKQLNSKTIYFHSFRNGQHLMQKVVEYKNTVYILEDKKRSDDCFSYYGKKITFNPELTYYV